MPLQPDLRPRYLLLIQAVHDTNRRPNLLPPAHRPPTVPLPDHPLPGPAPVHLIVQPLGRLPDLPVLPAGRLLEVLPVDRLPGNLPVGRHRHLKRNNNAHCIPKDTAQTNINKTSECK